MHSFFRALIVCLVTLALPASAQIQEGRTSVSLNASVAKYWGEYTSNLFGYGADLRIRHDISPYLGLQFQSGAATATFRITPYELQSYADYFGRKTYGDFFPNTLTRIDTLNAIRVFHHELLGVVHCLPSRSFVPQLYFGLGVVNHHATVAADNTPLPRGLDGRYSEWSTVFPVGVGFELAITDDISFSTSAIARISTDDNYDDLFVAGSSNDYFATVSAGLSVYIDGDLDSDRDGLPDKEERRLGLMRDAADTDGDSLSDYEELYIAHTDPRQQDSDRDGLLDGEEISRGTSPSKNDTDADGLGDAEELARGTEPTRYDTDNDGISDGDEVRRAGTNPARADTDNDGLNDQEEMRRNTNPLVPDTDGDGINDGAEVRDAGSDPLRSDTDRDGLSDAEEVQKTGTDPRDPDTDNDGVFDGEEVLRWKSNPKLMDTDYDGWSDGEEVLHRGTSAVNPDTDGDSIIDPKDPEPCGARCCGCSGKPSASPGVTTPEKSPDAPLSSTTPEKSPSKRRNYSIRFLRNSDRIDASDPETQRSLNELRDYLVNGCENARVTIEGHTSAEGSAEHNQSLSELRAQAVKSLLLQQGVAASKISGTVGYGATVPLVREPDERSRRRMSPLLLENLRRQNRRITLREDVSCD